MFISIRRKNVGSGRRLALPLLERLAREGEAVDDVRKRDLVALAVEVQVAKDKAAALGGAAAAS